MSSVLDRVRQLEKPATITDDETAETNVNEPVELDERITELQLDECSPQTQVEVEGSTKPLNLNKSVNQDVLPEEQVSSTSRGKRPISIPVPVQLPNLPILDPLPEDTHAPDSPTLSLIAALRQQISLLTDQSTDLNTKLITQLERASDLEDNLEGRRQQEQEKDVLIKKLEAEKAQWEENMNTGLLVERGSVREEMQRLVEGLVEEERRRGSAEAGRQQVEQEIDDLSVTLFEQANTMVAAEKYARAQAETRSRQAEENLAAAEAAMRDMQAHLQSLPSLLPAADVNQISNAMKRKYLAATITHDEFISFLDHVRHLKPRYYYQGQQPVSAPAISVLISQPFLARATLEDVDPTLRLDNAPDLGWLNRRSIQNAITNGELSIEPISIAALLSSSTYASHSGDIGCSMCGKSVLPPSAHFGKFQESLPPPSHPTAARASSNSRFSLKPFFATSSTNPSPSASPGANSTPAPPLPPVYIFRINMASSSSNDKEKDNLGRLYPLCASGWCLARLRAVCEWWRFIRTGLVDQIWKGEDGWVAPARPILAGLRKRSSVTPSEDKSAPTTPRASVTNIPELKETAKVEEKPELPPRKKTGWFSGLGSGKPKGETPPQSPTSESRNKFEAISRPASAGSNAEKASISTVQPPQEDIVQVTQQIFEEDSVKESDAKVIPDTLDVPSVDAAPTSPAESEIDDGGSAFLTPQSTASALPSTRPSIELTRDDSDAEPAPKAADEETRDEVKPLPSDSLGPGAAVDLSSPRSSMDITSALRRSVDGNRPPPTPPRSAARRAVPPPPPTSALAGNEIINNSASSSNPDTPKSPMMPSTPDPNAQSESIPVTPEPSSAKSNDLTPQATAPKLPPRSTGNRASLVPGNSAPSTTGKRYVEGDSWEAKTWKEVVRLKEDMWRARVGLVEDEE